MFLIVYLIPVKCFLSRSGSFFT